LRACAEECALAHREHSEQAVARIATVIGWLARPRLVSPRRSGTHPRVRAQQGCRASATCGADLTFYRTVESPFLFERRRPAGGRLIESAGAMSGCPPITSGTR
jgi:hypothetical protein